MTTLRPTSISTTPPQPDALLRIDEEVGGPSRISDDYVEGPPELIVGVAHSSAGSDTTECSSKCAAHDLHDQKRAYRRNGVQECLGQTIEGEQVGWFVLENGAYLGLFPDAEERPCPSGPPARRRDALGRRPVGGAVLRASAHGADAHRSFVEQLQAHG
jgi:hypothetical protein